MPHILRDSQANVVEGQSLVRSHTSQSTQVYWYQNHMTGVAATGDGSLSLEYLMALELALLHRGPSLTQAYCAWSSAVGISKLTIKTLFS